MRPSLPSATSWRSRPYVGGASNDLTGIDDPAENSEGLRDAQDGLAEVGI